jgi:low affinity Fe/Cu permease
MKIFSLFTPSFDRNGVLKIKIISRIWFFVCCIGLISVIVLAMMTDEPLHHYSTTAETAVETTSIVGVHAVLVALIIQYFKTTKIFNILKSLNEIDIKAKMLYIDIDHKKYKRNLALRIFGTIFLLFIVGFIIPGICYVGFFSAICRIC